MFETGIGNMDHAMTLPMYARPRMRMEARMAKGSNAVSRRDNSDDMERADTTRVRSLEVLAAAMVHELNQPLSTILLGAEACLRTLSDERPNLERARETARLALDHGRRAAAAVGRLWSLFAKTEANRDVVDLNETLREALALCSQELERRRVIVRPELAPHLPRVTGDCLQLQQAILSLLMNAAEAMSQVEDRPRELVVRTQSAEGHVRLSVRDAGEGFKPGEADRLFDAFYTTKADGMGIGLFISRWIIENHGGALHAALNDGPGATFSIVVPCRES
jgi:signal transduction histidine kinase